MRKKQLNVLFQPGNEKRLKAALFRRLKPLHPQIPVESFIDKIVPNINTSLYRQEIISGEFCEYCKGPYCCIDTDMVALVPEDIKRIESHGHTDFVRETKRGPSVKKTKPCQFLKDNKCTIYEYRPIVCQVYPFVCATYTQVPALDEDVLVFTRHQNCCVAFNLLAQQISDVIEKHEH